jgi:NADH-quinone oxidoreductase subunit N
MTTMQATLATPAASEFLPLIPELVLVGSAFALLMLDLFLNEKQRVVTHLLAVASLVLVAALLVAGTGGQGTVLGGMFIRDNMADVLKIGTCVVSAIALAVWLAVPARTRPVQGRRSRC